MDDFTRIFKALSDKNRVRILKMLENRPLCVCEITSVLNISISTVSSHLNILKDAGFIIDKKEGRWVEYQILRSADNPVLHQIMAMLPAWLNDNNVIANDSERVGHTDREQICSS